MISTIYSNVEQYNNISTQIHRCINNISPKQTSSVFNECLLLLEFIKQYNYKPSKEQKKYITEYRSTFKHIHSDLLSKFCVKINNKVYHYNNLIYILEEAKEIEILKGDFKYNMETFESYRTNSFITGTLPKGYRIIKKKKESDILEIKLDISKIFENAISIDKLKLKHKDDIRCTNVINNMENYDINIEPLSRFLVKYQNCKIKDVIKTKRSKKIVQVPLDSAKINDIIIDCAKIKENILFLTKSEEGRHYTSFANLYKICVPFIYERCGIPNRLKELDVKACQPSFLAFIFKCPQFQKIIENGEYYEEIMKVYGVSREKAKNINMFLMFDEHKLNQKIIEKLDKAFKGLADFLNKNYKNKTIREQRLFHILQKMESYIFCELLCDFCMKNKINYITRHDSVLVDRDDARKVKTFIEKSIFNEYGIKVKITSKSQEELLTEIEINLIKSIEKQK